MYFKTWCMMPLIFGALCTFVSIDIIVTTLTIPKIVEIVAYIMRS